MIDPIPLHLNPTHSPPARPSRPARHSAAINGPSPSAANAAMLLITAPAVAGLPTGTRGPQGPRHVRWGEDGRLRVYYPYDWEVGCKRAEAHVPEWPYLCFGEKVPPKVSCRG